MPMTPIEIENHTFDVKMRGFDRDQVKSFLAALAEEATTLHAENSRLVEETGTLKKKVAETDSRDKKLQETILALRDMTEKMKDETRKEREMILREARQQAERIIQDARVEAQKIETHITQLSIDRDNFEDRLRLLLDEHQRLMTQRRHDAVTPAGIPTVGKRTGAEQ